MRWLEEKATLVPGIFRLSGSHHDIKVFIEELETGLEGMGGGGKGVEVKK